MVCYDVSARIIPFCVKFLYLSFSCTPVREDRDSYLVSARISAHLPLPYLETASINRDSSALVHRRLVDDLPVPGAAVLLTLRALLNDDDAAVVVEPYGRLCKSVAILEAVVIFAVNLVIDCCDRDGVEATEPVSDSENVSVSRSPKSVADSTFKSNHAFTRP